jgi:hypothetical protein
MTELRVPTGVTESTLQSDSGFIAAAEQSLDESLEVSEDDVAIQWLAVSDLRVLRGRMLQAAKAGEKTVQLETGYAIKAESAASVEKIGKDLKSKDIMSKFRTKATEKMGSADFESEELKNGKVSMGEKDPEAREVLEYAVPARSSESDSAASQTEPAEVSPAVALATRDFGQDSQSFMGSSSQVTPEQLNNTGALVSVDSSSNSAEPATNSAATQNVLLTIMIVFGAIMLA